MSNLTSLGLFRPPQPNQKAPQVKTAGLLSFAAAR